MKKLYSLFFAVLSVSAFAQVPVLTAVLDGPCTGGIPKVLEIYANGAVDFSQFTVQNQTNANTDWAVGTSGSQDLSSFGIRTNEFVYIVMTNGNLALATAEYPAITAANSIESGVMNLNGDDRIRIINTATSVVIDQFGVSDVDGTGTTWEWLDSYAVRNDGSIPTGTFNEASWTFFPINSLDGTGLCNTAEQLNTAAPLGQYSLSVAQHAIPGLKVYPNPVTNGTLYIDSNSASTKTVVIYDVVGKQVLKTTTASAVNVANLSGGVYVVKITEEGKTATRKLVIR
ncbi:MAG: T9SS type A sorting domain-containing protein [Flavobacterium sp.]|nr:T9SS type A sorting domain-containing protein [Flavobacterium sp.]